MLGIPDLLNQDDGNITGSLPLPRALNQSDLLPDASVPPLSLNEFRPRRLLCSRIHPRVLKGHSLINIALRRKSTNKRAVNPASFGLKLHLKLLEAGLRVRLLLCPSVYEIYNQLIPITLQNSHLYHLVYNGSMGHLQAEDVTGELYTVRKRPVVSYLNGDQHRAKDFQGKYLRSGPSSVGLEVPDYSNYPVTEAGTALLTPGKCISKRVRLIDNNLVDLAGVSTKVLKTLTYDGSSASLPRSGSDLDGFSPIDVVTTFNMLDTAISSLFKIQKYALVRVTKSASSNTEGLTLVKLETAKPGDPLLIDDKDFVEDMVASLGRPNQVPNNLFIKKVVARPRYKVDMKLFVTSSDRSLLLYVDPRVFERDLINGIIDLESPLDRDIYTTFLPGRILDRVHSMLVDSANISGNEGEPSIPNHMRDDINHFLDKSIYGMKQEGSTESSSNSLSPSVFSPSACSLSASSSSSTTGLAKVEE